MVRKIRINESTDNLIKFLVTVGYGDELYDEHIYTIEANSESEAKALALKQAESEIVTYVQQEDDYHYDVRFRWYNGLWEDESVSELCEESAIDKVFPYALATLSIVDITNADYIYIEGRAPENVVNVVVKNGVRRISRSAFYKCKNLASIIIPNSVTYIGYDAFRNCKNLTSIIIPDSVTTIEEGAFEDCVSLKSITIPNNIKRIEEETFFGCTSLTSITIPDSVTSIDRGAFKDCPSLKSITIPNSVTSIGEDVFRWCDNLTVYTDNDYVINYCKENNVSVKPLSAKTESINRRRYYR